MHDGDDPLEGSVRDGAPATAGAPSTGGVQSSCCVAMSHRAAGAPRPAAARRPEGPGSTRGQTVDTGNREPDRLFALYRALCGIDELTQEEGTIREPGFVHPEKYATGESGGSHINQGLRSEQTVTPRPLTTAVLDARLVLDRRF